MEPALQLIRAPERYAAYVSHTPVGGLLNVRILEPKPKDNEWVFARYTLRRPGVLSVELLADDLMKGTAEEPNAIRASLSRLKDDPGLFVG